MRNENKKEHEYFNVKITEEGERVLEIQIIRCI